MPPKRRPGRASKPEPEPDQSSETNASIKVESVPGSEPGSPLPIDYLEAVRKFSRTMSGWEPGGAWEPSDGIGALSESPQDVSPTDLESIIFEIIKQKSGWRKAALAVLPLKAMDLPTKVTCLISNLNGEGIMDILQINPNYLINILRDNCDIPRNILEKAMEYLEFKRLLQDRTLGDQISDIKMVWPMIIYINYRLGTFGSAMLKNIKKHKKTRKYKNKLSKKKRKYKNKLSKKKKYRTKRS